MSQLERNMSFSFGLLSKPINGAPKVLRTIKKEFRGLPLLS